MAPQEHLKSAVDTLSEEIKRYRNTDPNDGNTLVECLQQITPILYYLETERANFHKKFQSIIHEEVLKGQSVARAENLAHVEVPEMYLLRRIMDSAEGVRDSIRTQISWIKTGLNN
jgi:hypothetical protein